MISIVIFVLENVWAAVCQKKWTPRHENLTVCSIKDVYLIELNRRLCSFFGYLCGAQCTEDPKKWISNVSLEISYVFASYFREHLGKQHRGRSAGQWLMCQTYNDQRTRQIITIIIWWVLPAVSLGFFSLGCILRKCFWLKVDIFCTSWICNLLWLKVDIFCTGWICTLS